MTLTTKGWDGQTFIWTRHALSRWINRSTYGGSINDFALFARVAMDSEAEWIRPYATKRERMETTYWVSKTKGAEVWRVMVTEKTGFREQVVVTYYEFPNSSRHKEKGKPVRVHRWWRDIMRLGNPSAIRAATISGRK